MSNPRRLALAALTLALAPGALAQNGSPLPLFSGDLQGLPPTHAGQTWPSIKAPLGNPFVASLSNPFVPAAGSTTEILALLGKSLFWDEQLSSDGTMACATCHEPKVGGIDERGGFTGPNNKDGSLGMIPQNAANDYRADVGLQLDRRVTGVNPPSFIGGAAFKTSNFWDGRAGPRFFDANGAPILILGVDAFPDSAALEAQAVGPPVSAIEMAHDALTWQSGAIQAKLNNAMPLALARNLPPSLQVVVNTGLNYAQAFDLAFANTIFPGALGVTRERLAMAIASYERTLVPNQAPIDTRALLPAEQRGFNIFVNSGCVICHADPNPARSPGPVTLLPGGGFSNPFDSMLTDGVRHPAINVPGPNPNFGVVTPSLRNVALKSQYFHNGSVKTLANVIAFYNGQLGNAIFRFNPPLNAQGISDVTAFFHALTDPRVAGEQFPFDRPQLHSEQFLHGVNEFGTPTPNPGMDILANVPLLDLDPNFKVGVKGAPANATGVIGFAPTQGPGPFLWLGSAGLVTAPVTVDPTGFSTFKLGPIPGSLAGLTFHAQWVVVNPLTNQLDASNAATFVVQ